LALSNFYEKKISKFAPNFLLIQGFPDEKSWTLKKVFTLSYMAPERGAPGTFQSDLCGKSGLAWLTKVGK